MLNVLDRYNTTVKDETVPILVTASSAVVSVPLFGAEQIPIKSDGLATFNKLILAGKPGQFFHRDARYL